MKALNIFSVLLLLCIALCGCAGSKKHRTTTDKTSETAGMFATKNAAFDLLRTEVDTLILTAADSLLATFPDDSVGVVRTAESGSMVVQIVRTASGQVLVKATAKPRTTPVKQSRTELKTRSSDSNAKTETRTAETAEVQQTERKALVPEWAWAAGFGLLVLVIAFFLYRFLNSATKND